MTLAVVASSWLKPPALPGDDVFFELLLLFLLLRIRDGKGVSIPRQCRGLQRLKQQKRQGIAGQTDGLHHLVIVVNVAVPFVQVFEHNCCAASNAGERIIGHPDIKAGSLGQHRVKPA